MPTAAEIIQKSIDDALAQTTGRVGSPTGQTPRVRRRRRERPRETAPPSPEQARRVIERPRGPRATPPPAPAVPAIAPPGEGQRLLELGQQQVERNLAREALLAAPLRESGIVNEAVRAAQARRAGVAPPSEGARFDQFRAGGSVAAQQNAALFQRYQQAGITPPQNLLDARNQRVAPPYFGGFPGIPADALQVDIPRTREVVTTGDIGPYPERINYQGEQAMLTPVAVLDAFFSGTDGSKWGYGAFYSGVNPEDRNPPAFFSPLTYAILSQTVDPELIAEFYDQDPVTGYWVRKTGSEDLPIDAGFGGFGGFGGFQFPSFSFGGGGGGGTPRSAGMGLVNWRI